MRFLAFLVILGGFTFVLFSYFDGSRIFNGIQTEMQRASDQKRAQAIANAKDIYWARFYQSPKDCLAPPSALRELECKNRADQMRERFERQWSLQIASGWVPPEVSK
ncbi:MAG: hypothetical protein JWM26_1831 [Betaproteobacteria bacterium]|jgi:hypothetical protein|nr:hypothetical protein [Betaproteobacteria bacterium]